MKTRERFYEWAWVVGLAVGLTYAVLVLLSANVLAADPDDYAYRTPLTVTNSGSGGFEGEVCADLNPGGLASGGFMGADGQDAALFDAGGGELYVIRQQPTSNSVCWLLNVDEIPAGQSEVVYLYTGGVDNPQTLVLRGASDTVDVADAASLDVTTNLTIEALDVVLGTTSPTDGVFFTGGTVTAAEGFRVHTFTSDSTLTMDRAGVVYYLCVAGGGGGGGAGASANGAGGGGAGGVSTGTVSIDATQAITVGTGGGGGANDADPGDDGEDSTIGGLVDCTGGGGGGGANTNVNGRAGGSGGGGGSNTSGSGGAGTVGQGNDGTAGNSGASLGGGGGGLDGSGSSGAGGPGASIAVPGGALAVGGGGAGAPAGGGTRSGGLGGGGDAVANGAGEDGTDGTGGGGGGAGSNAAGTFAGGDGGDGLIIVWYRTGHCLVCKAGAYSLWVDGATLTADFLIAGSPETLTSSGLVAGTEYDVAATYDGSTFALLVDGATASSDTPSGSIATTTDDVVVTTTGGPLTIGHVRIGGTSVVSPTYVLDWQFKPADLAVSQTAASGNAWTWVIDVADQSSSTNDGTWTFMGADFTNATVTADALELLAPGTSLATVSTDLPDVVGTIPGVSTATSSSDSFTGDDGLNAVIEFTGLETGTGWFLLALTLAIGAGIPLVRLTAGWVGAVWMGFAMGIPAVLEWYGWAWVLVGGFLCFGAAGTSAWLGKR